MNRFKKADPLIGTSSSMFQNTNYNNYIEREKARASSLLKQDIPEPIHTNHNSGPSFNKVGDTIRNLDFSDTGFRIKRNLGSNLDDEIVGPDGSSTNFKYKFR